MLKESNIIQQLRQFYNEEAKKFSASRKKKWPEFEYILKQIKNYPKRKIKILELGCGDGRLFGYLKQHLDKPFEYVGVDLSENLIQIAKSRYKDENAQFVVGEMFEYLKSAKQQDYDFVIMVASFQHLPSKEMRLSVLKGVYKVLEYQGKLILINWSFSKWFIKKYRKEILKSIIKYVFSFGRWSWNDVWIPRKSEKGVVFKRYYHIFTIDELKSLLKLSGFIVEKGFYIDKFGKISSNWTEARNTFVVARKDVMD